MALGPGKKLKERWDDADYSIVMKGGREISPGVHRPGIIFNVKPKGAREWKLVVTGLNNDVLDTPAFSPETDWDSQGEQAFEVRDRKNRLIYQYVPQRSNSPKGRADTSEGDGGTGVTAVQSGGTATIPATPADTQDSTYSDTFTDAQDSVTGEGRVLLANVRVERKSGGKEQPIDDILDKVRSMARQDGYCVKTIGNLGVDQEVWGKLSVDYSESTEGYYMSGRGAVGTVGTVAHLSLRLETAENVRTTWDRLEHTQQPPDFVDVNSTNKEIRDRVFTEIWRSVPPLVVLKEAGTDVLSGRRVVNTQDRASHHSSGPLPRPVIVWKYKVATRPVMSPCIAGRLVITGSWAGLVALDRQTGESVWYYKPEGRVRGRVELFDNVLVVGKHEGNAGGEGIVGLNPRTGKELWRWEGEGHTFRQFGLTSKGVLALGSQGYGSDGKSTIVVLNPQLGEPVLEMHMDYLIGNLTLHGDQCYFDWTRGDSVGVACLDVARGDVSWEVPVKTARHSSVGLLFADGRLYACHSRLLAIDVSTRRLVWSVPIEADGIPVYADQRLYVLAHDGYVRALDADTGRALWRSRVSAKPYTARGRYPLALVDGVLYGKTGYNYLFAVGPEHGFVKWMNRYGGSGETSGGGPVVSGGYVYLPTDEDLYCLGSEPDDEREQAEARRSEEMESTPAKEHEGGGTVHLEKLAAARLELAKGLMSRNLDAAKRQLQKIVEKYPSTETAREARRQLEEME